VGLAVCYDVRFPELFRNLSAAGAEVLVLPSAFTAPTGRAHWETLLRARAIENLCHMIAPAQSGFHPNGRETYGDSMIIDHWGRILARLPRGRGCVTAMIDLARQAEVRKSFPVLEHRVL
jgi:nitrilase